jgi:WhiB family transcriptional regulator, redox-sensing transcriptional regulator
VRFAKVLCDPEKDPDLWFPDTTLGSYGRRMAVQKAKAICKGCPVRAACLQMALDADIQYGIWGGLTEHERRRLKQRQGQ